MKTQLQIRTELEVAVETVRAYRTSDLYMHFIKLLDAMDEQHRDNLITVGAEGFQRMQGAASQVCKLRNALVTDNKFMYPI